MWDGKKKELLVLLAVVGTIVSLSLYIYVCIAYVYIIYIARVFV